MGTDWRKLRMEYVTGQLSYKDMAEKHGVPYSTLSKAATKAGWVAAREAHRAKVTARTAEAMCERTSAREVQRLLRLQEAALDTVALLADVLRDPDQFRRHLVVRSTTGVGSETEERIFEKIDMRAIRAYTASMQSMTATMRNLFDMPTAQEQQAMDIQQTRLRLDQEKRSAADTGTGGTGIAQIAAVLPAMGPDGTDGLYGPDADAGGGGEGVAEGDEIRQGYGAIGDGFGDDVDNGVNEISGMGLPDRARRGSGPGGMDFGDRDASLTADDGDDDEEGDFA